MKRFGLISVLLCAVSVSPLYSDDRFESEVGAFASEHAVEGTVVITSLRNEKTFIFNHKRSQERFLPASTFKVVNTLILLQEGAVSDENAVLRWDGVSRDVSAWNADQSLQSAFASSCVWFYHSQSKKIPMRKYTSWLDILKYGNRTSGGNDKPFWLYGSVRISAAEQIEVMRNVYFEKYPFKKEYYRIVKEMMIADKTDTYVLRAKTGTTPSEHKPVTGWYVGYIETGDDVWFFACNIEMKNKEYGKLRKEMTLHALKAAGAI